MTSTSIIGIYCSDGIIIGTDSAVSLTQGEARVIEQEYEKIYVVADRVLIAGSGSIGLGQRFHEIVKQEWDNQSFRKTPIEVAKKLTARTLKDWQDTSQPIGKYTALVAFASGQERYLVEYALNDFQPEFKDNRLWHCSAGSAQFITDPFLAFIREVYWQRALPSVTEAIFAATWALDHAIKINPGGVNGPVQIGVLEINAKGLPQTRLLNQSDVDEVRQHISDTKEILRKSRSAPPPPILEIPKPQ